MAKVKRRPHSISFEDSPSLTQQKFKEECDVNKIVRTYAETGILPHVNRAEQRFGYAPALEFREALELVRAQDDYFNELPATVRARFNNDTEELLEFIENPDNLEEARQLGLAMGEPLQDVGPEEEATAPSPSPSELAPASSEAQA